MIHAGTLEKNPVDSIRIPRVSAKKVKVHFSDQDIQKIRTHIQVHESSVQKHQTKLLISLLVTTGQRIGSLLQLKASDISKVQDFVVMSIILKGAKKAFVPLQSEVAECLFRLVRKRPDQEYLFSAQRGQSKDLDRPMTHAGAYKLIKKVISEAGIDGNFTPHAFRSYVITSLIKKKNGESLERVQKMVAFHSSPMTTQKYIDQSIYETFENHPLLALQS
jgi:integrase/recombinase XerD